MQTIINKCNSSLYIFFSIVRYSEDARSLRIQRTLDFWDCFFAAFFHLITAFAVQTSIHRLSSPLHLEVLKKLENHTENSRPFVGQEISFKREFSNQHDRLAKAEKALLPNKLTCVVIGHIPREISRHTWNAILIDTLATSKVEDTKPKTSPLVQSGFEIIMCLKVQWNDEKKHKNRKMFSKWI